MLLFTNHLLLLIFIIFIHESPQCIAVRSTPKFKLKQSDKYDPAETTRHKVSDNTLDGSKLMLSDSYKVSSLHAKKDYVLFPGKPRWTRHVPMTLSYAFSKENMINYLHITDIKAVFKRAFSKWASVIPVSFIETDDYDFADIRIGFYSGDHGDGEPFDGVLGVLAHSFSPESGKFHLDAAETWAVDFGSEKSPVAVDLESVAVHEIGHLLGLTHSPVKEAVMYPTLKPRDKKVDLALDDIQGVQALYGSNPNFTIGSLVESDISTNLAVDLRIKSSMWATLMLHYLVFCFCINITR